MSHGEFLPLLCAKKLREGKIGYQFRPPIFETQDLVKQNQQKPGYGWFVSAVSKVIKLQICEICQILGDQIHWRDP